MNRLSRRRVVDHLANQLIQRRRASIERRAAYLALAHAILSDEPQPRLDLPAFERHPTSIGPAALAA